MYKLYRLDQLTDLWNNDNTAKIMWKLFDCKILWIMFGCLIVTDRPSMLCHSEVCIGSQFVVAQSPLQKFTSAVFVSCLLQRNSAVHSGLLHNLLQRLTAARTSEKSHSQAGLANFSPLWSVSCYNTVVTPLDTVQSWKNINSCRN